MREGWPRSTGGRYIIVVPVTLRSQKGTKVQCSSTEAGTVEEYLLPAPWDFPTWSRLETQGEEDWEM